VYYQPPKKLPPEYYENKELNGRIWKLLEKTFRDRFGLKMKRDDAYYAALLIWSETVEGSNALRDAEIEAINNSLLKKDDKDED